MTVRPLRKAVFPVGGLGTRFLPATKAMPKEMLPVVDRPLIQYAVDEALEEGIEQMIFVTGRGKSAIEDHFDIAYELEATMTARGKSLSILDATRLKPGAVAYVRQQEPMGLGHAVWCAFRALGIYAQPGQAAICGGHRVTRSRAPARSQAAICDGHRVTRSRRRGVWAARALTGDLRGGHCHAEARCRRRGRRRALHKPAGRGRR